MEFCANMTLFLAATLLLNRTNEPSNITLLAATMMSLPSVSENREIESARNQFHANNTGTGLPFRNIPHMLICDAEHGD